MFPPRYFAERYMAARMYPPAISGGTPPEVITTIRTPVKTIVFRKRPATSEVVTR